MLMEIDLIHWFGLDYLVNPHKRLYWGYLLSSFLIVILFLVFSRKSLSVMFNKKIWWHTSARLDYIYFFVISVIKVTLLLPWILSVREVAFSILQLMESLFGYQPKIVVERQWLIVGYTLALFLFSDFTRYWLHRVFHKISFLWYFHKVHHSAEVLTPITFYRVHPIENILFGLRYALAAGVVTGVFAYYFGAVLSVVDILGVNIFVFALHFMGDNLRHSPIRLSYLDVLENWLISPAQHQYHHTVQGSGVNYGGSLAIWDRLFGTLRYSRRDDVYSLGTDDKNRYSSIAKLLLLPFINITLKTGQLLQYEKIK